MVSRPDYRINTPAINVPDPTANLINAANLAGGIKQSRLADQKAELLQQQQAQEMQKFQQTQGDLAFLYENPTPGNVAKIMTHNPELSEEFTRTYDVLSKEAQNDKIHQASQVYAALESERPDIASEILTEQANAYRNSGNEQEAKVFEDLNKLIERDPKLAKVSSSMFLSHAMGPDKFVDTFTKLGMEKRDQALQGTKLTKAQAEANKAATEAKFSESQETMDLVKKGWDISKLQTDIGIAKQNAKIATAERAAKKQADKLKREETLLKIEGLKRDRDRGVRTKAAEIETSRTGIDNSLNTIDRLIGNPELDNVIGALEGRRFYPSTLMAVLNPMADADVRADASADIETVQGQQFLDNLMAAKERGASFGSLTEREGAKLQGYISSLKTKQSEKQFRENLSNIQRMLLKSRNILAEKYGVPENIPDRPEMEFQPQQMGGDLPSQDTTGFRVLGIEG